MYTDSIEMWNTITDTTSCTLTYTQ